MNNHYFKEMERIPLLTVEEEKTLAAKALSGDKKAQNELVKANLRFVVKIANQYQGFMETDDLINEGNLGLIHAAGKFNPASGTRFITYAQFWIRAYIQKAIRETSTGIKFPASRYDEMKKSKWSIASLDKAIKGDDGEEATLMSFIKDERIVEPGKALCEKESAAQLRKLIKTLKQNEQYVLNRRFGLDGDEPMSLSEIGTLMGCSKENVRQLEKKAFVKLRRNIAGSKEYCELAA